MMSIRLITAAAVLAAVVTVTGTAGAQNYRQDRSRDVRVVVNGDRVNFDAIGPREVKGHVLVPLRGVLEKLGALVDWDAGSQTVFANGDGIKIELPIGSRYASVNGERVALDLPAITLAGTTMVPLRFLSETLGATVDWNNDTNTVRISSGDRAQQNRYNDDRTGAGQSNRRSHEWNQSTVGRDPKMPIVESVTSDIVGNRIRGGDRIQVTMRATPGGRGFFRIRMIFGEQKMIETSPGIYVGSWRAPAGPDVQIERKNMLAFVVVGDRATAEKSPVNLQ